MGKNVISDDEDEVEELEGEAVEEEDNAPARRYNDDDEDEDDEEGQDEYEQDDFIVDDVDEEEPGEEEEKADSDEERHKKKKKKKKREVEDLDEDDYELLRDNNAFHRRPKDSKKFKRLKKAQRDVDGFEHSEDEFDGSGEGGRTAEEKLKRSLFGDDEGQYEDIPEEEEQVEEELDVGEDDDMADFIVDEDYVDENGAPVRKKHVKGRKFKKAEGVSSSAINEAHEIFGDVDELLLKRKRGMEHTEWSEEKLEDQFEPTILSEKYMTRNDERIRDNDIPERMQLSEESTGHPPTENIILLEESAWILKQLNSGVVPFCGQSQVEYAEKGAGLSISKADLYEFLCLHNVQKMDIPFIAMYRMEECSSLLKDPVSQGIDDMNQEHSGGVSLLKWHKMLWAIQDLDRKWLLLQKRKAALNLHYHKRFDEEKCRIYDITRSNLNEQLFESICNSLKNAESEREVDDVDMKFNLHFPPGEVDLDEGKYKRPRRRSHYSVCSKAGFWEVASKFGCSAEQLGNCLSLIRVGEELEDAKETPEEVASNFTCNMFETPQEVLKGARHMAAVEISCEPSVRKHVRSTYMDHATVSTVPTADGRVAIDAFHQFASIKWLLNKPIREFNDVQWLLIQKAEEDKLLQVTFKLPEETMGSLMNEIKNYYLSPGVSKSAQLWNEQRELILQDAFHGFLLPSMEKEARALLTTKAKTWVLWEYGKALWDKVSVGPFQRRDNDITTDDEAAPRVMACCWGPGKPATTFVMLDSSGELLDILYTGALTLRSQNVNDQQRKKNDQQRLLKFMMDHQPHVVVLGAANLSCTRLKTDIYEIIFKMVEENPRDMGNEMSDINIVYGDESLPRLYENSRISADQFPAQPGIVKRAVALGRYLQNPLAMVASLCGPAREILSWKLSHLENFLTADDKYSMIEQVMVDVTNQVGLDINLATGHEWLFSPLQFISGFGPRKAVSLQRSLVRSGAVYTRKDFLTTHGLGKRVFLNAAGFLRVRRSGQAASYTQFMDLLDDTRINPESYGLAQEMAKVVYETETGEANDEEALEMAIEHVRDCPNLLKKLDLDDDSPGSYVKVKNRENKKETLKYIRKELIQGFQDWRKPYKEPSQDEEFYMISGETDETLAEGRIVQATVRKVLGPRAICALESGLTGMLMKEDYADDWRDIPELSDRLHEEDILTCKIKSILKNRYQVFLVCKESEMRNSNYQHPGKLDKYYHEDRSSLHSDQEKARKEKELAKKHFKPRMIVHPRFQNITADEAMEFLSDKEPGESIIRPSSRGPSFLTLSLKVHDGVYAHKDIVEGGKEHKDITSLLRLGKTLKIGEDTFEDLDEVMDRYVDPLVGHLKAMLSYRKFRRGNKAEVDDLLRLEKSEFPMRIVYAFGISHEHPGTFILTYIRSSNPHHEYIGVYPKGFKFRKRMFEDIDRLVAYFQQHINDPVHDSGPSIRSVAAMVPMRDQSFDRDRSSQHRTGRDGGNRDGQPGGFRGRGRGRGRGSYNGTRGNDTGNDRHDSGYDNPRWGSTSKDGEGGWGSAKANNSPVKEAFAGGWGAGGGESSAGAGEWGRESAAGDGSSGWGGEGKASGWGGGGNDENNGWGSQKSSGGAKADDGWSTGAGTGGGSGGW